MTQQGLTIIQLDAHDLWRVKRNSELSLRVFMSRRTLHAMFKGLETLAKYPLVVQLPDPKAPGVKRLVNVSAREEYYGAVRLFDRTRTAAEQEFRPSDSGS